MKNTATILVAMAALKYSLNKTYLGKRPNGGDRGVPSGHTSATCSGAFFMANRYGWQYTASGLVIAAFTGYSRVDEGYHHWRDMIAGCALAYGTSYYFVNSFHSKLSITPEVDPKFIGIKLGAEF